MRLSRQVGGGGGRGCSGFYQNHSHGQQSTDNFPSALSTFTQLNLQHGVILSGDNNFSSDSSLI